MNTQNLSLDMLRALALMQHEGDEYFFLEDEQGEILVFEGSEDEAREEFEAEVEGTDDPATDSNFLVYCLNNLTQVEEIDENGNGRYMVLTDDEADEKWDEYLDNYIDECILPEIPETYQCYFDDEKWKRDARIDGRGHCLASYDGHENEETVEGTTFYIYRT
jgi:hypothetical protein